MNKLENEFNDFIKKWCNSHYAHLVDTDENDGERFREKLRNVIDKKRVDELIAANRSEVYDKMNQTLKYYQKKVEEVIDKAVDKVEFYPYKYYKGLEEEAKTEIKKEIKKNLKLGDTNAKKETNY